MKLKRTVSLILVLIFMLPIMACSEKKTAIYSIGDVSITDDMYRYWLSYYKTFYVKNFSDIKDTEEGWKAELIDGMTAEEYVFDSVDKRMRMYVSAMFLAKEYKLSLSNDTKRSIDKTIDTLVDNYGGKSNLIKALKKSCNITLDGLKEVYRAEALINMLSEYLYGEGGPEALTVEDIDKFYKANYSRVKYLYFDKEKKYVYNDKGEIKTDALGNPVTEKLTEEDLKKLKETANEALAAVKADGADWDKLIEKYNTEDMNYVKTEPDGFYISSESYTSKYVYTIVSEGMSMTEGDIKLCEDEYAIYVIEKFELKEGAYLTDKTGQLDNIEASAVNDAFYTLLEESSKDIVINKEYLSSIKIGDVGANINVA